MVLRSGSLSLGLGALFLGALLGGALGAMLFTPKAAETAPSPERTSIDMSAVVAALATLTEEVRRLQIARPPQDAAARQPVSSEDPQVPMSDEGLLGAIERLTLALSQAPSRVAATGNAAPLVVPVGTHLRRNLLAAMEGRSAEELSRELRFLTYQQILERFGAPDEASRNGDIRFQLASGGNDEITVSMSFVDGYLFNIYY